MKIFIGGEAERSFRWNRHLRHPHKGHQLQWPFYVANEMEDLVEESPVGGGPLNLNALAHMTLIGGMRLTFHVRRTGLPERETYHLSPTP